MVAEHGRLHRRTLSAARQVDNAVGRMQMGFLMLVALFVLALDISSPS